MRRSAPRQTLVLVITALATVLATCVAVAHGDSERDQRHERQLAIAENDLLHATVGPLDRLTDVASTVQGPLSVRRAQFDALASRLLDQKALTSVALARSAGDGAPVRSGADDAITHPQRFTIVYSSSRGKGDPTRDAIQQSAARTALQGAIRSGDTRSTGVLPAVGGSPRSLAVAVPVRAAGSGASGAFLATFSVPAVRAAVGAHLPPGTRIALAQGDAVDGLPNALEKRVRLGDRDWTVAVGQPAARQGLALATLLVGGLLTILIGVVGSQARRRERDALGVIAMRRAERDRAELARLEAEARSRVLAETSTDLICVLEPDGAVRYASPACRDLLGLEPEALLGRAFTDLVHEDDAAGVAAVLGGGEEAPVSITHRMRRAERLGVGRDAAARRPRPRDPRPRRDPRDRPRRRRAHALAGRAGRGRGALPLRLRGGADRHGADLARLPLPARQPRAVPDHRLHAAAARGPAGRLDHPPGRPQGRLGGARGDARGRALQPPRRAPLPARLGQRGVGGGQLDAGAQRRRQAAPLPLADAGHHRAPPPRGRAAPHGRPRPADRAAQPPLVRARARAPRRLRRALRAQGRRDRARPRPLQDDQRHARPLGRRRADRARRPRPAQPPARVRRARAPRRRRVRDPAARGHAGGGRRGRRRRARRRAHARRPHRHRAHPHGDREPRHRAVRQPRQADRRGRARQRRPRDVRRQGVRPRPALQPTTRRSGPRRGSRRASRGRT